MTLKNNVLLIFLVCISVLTSCEEQVENTIEEYSILPIPQELEIKNGRFELNKDTDFIIQNDTEVLKKSSEVFRSFILREFDFDLKVKTLKKVKANFIEIAIKKGMESDEAYSLSITEKSVHIIGGSETGVFNGLQSLRLLLNTEDVKKGATVYIPNVQIKDAPRYSWRGVMIDESRHFFGKEKIKQLLELMALQKLNKFHWHLTDEPGWRIEIKKYPKLTSIGALGTYSDHDEDAQFYTQEDIKEIIDFASQRHIEVIPEIDMPGHASAAMRAYPEFSGGGTEKHPHFTLHPARLSTYAFLTDVLKEITVLFPSKYIHIGADEVSFGNKHWANDEDVITLMHKEKLKNIKEVETYFINRIRDTIISLNKDVIGWDEVVENNMDNENTVVMWWRHDKPQILEKGLEHDYKMILCPRRPLYFDFVQDDSHKVGRRWDGFCPLDDVYNFPDSLNIDTENPKVLGMQANLWTEQISTEERFDYMLYPRISALAEAAWTKKRNKSFESFQQRLKKILKIYESENIYYFNYFLPEKTKEPGDILKPDWVKNFNTYK